jgi:hypothetical protein
MSGRPRFWALVEAIAAKGDEDNDPDGEAWVFDQIADGKSLQNVADDLKVGRSTLWRWVNQHGPDSTRRKAFEAARELSAYALEDQGADVLDDLADKDFESQDVALAKARSDYRKWQASIRNKNFRDQASAGNVTVNIQTLHLEALKAHGGPKAIVGKVVEAVTLPEQSQNVLEPDPIAGLLE